MPASAYYDPIMQAPDIPDGWTPAQASDWMGAQVQYADAVKHYGENSPEATRARSRMTMMARALRPDEIQPLNTAPTAGTNGTLAKPEVFDQWVPVAADDTPEGQFSPKDNLNIPPQ